MKTSLDTNQDQALRQVAGQAFYNTSQFTLRDAVKLMARLMCLLIAEEIESGTYLLYDGALVCGAAVFVSADARQCAAARRFGLEVAVL